MAVELKRIHPVGELGRTDIEMNTGGVENVAYITDPHDEKESQHVVINGVDSNIEDQDTKIQDLRVDEDVLEEASDRGPCMKGVEKAQEALGRFFARHGYFICHVIYGILIAGYSAYFTYSLCYEFGSEASIRLLWMTMVAVFLCFVTLIRDNFGKEINEKIFDPIVGFIDKHYNIFKYGFIFGIIAGFIIYISLQVARYRPRNLVSLTGYIIYVGLLFLFSANPAKVRWRPVLWGLGLQFIFAFLVMRTQWGYTAFKWIGDRISEYMAYADAGAEFVFGESFRDHMFAMQVMPVVIFFSATISVLYYLGTMQTIILKIAWLMQRTLGTTAAESVNAAGNIFVGQTEAPLLIRPMMKAMTKSELHAVMVGGYATIAGSVMATYILFGVPANHLVSASIMAAPCALAISKLFYPETEESKTTAEDVGNMERPPYSNVVEAAAAGASDAIPVVANICANLIAFLSILQFINTVLTWMGHRAGLYPPEHEELTFEFLCSYLLWPFAFIMGVPTHDCRTVAELIGVKTFLNEFVAYTELSKLIDNSDQYKDWRANYGENATYIRTGRDMYLPETNQTLVGGIIDDTTETIATYALCGFANVGSIGTVIGVLGTMAPNRAHEISQLATRAMIAGNIVSFMNACTAGLLYNPGIQLGS